MKRKNQITEEPKLVLTPPKVDVVLVSIPWNKIRPSPTNPRKFFAPDKLQELADSIRVHNIKQPPLVRALPKYKLVEPDMVDKTWRIVSEETAQIVDSYPEANENLARMVFGSLTEHDYELVCGERRWRAAELAELKEINCVVEVLSDEQVLAIQLIENDQREDINPFERAEGYRRLKELGFSVEEICQKVGQKRSTYYAALAGLKLAPEVKTVFLESGLDASFVNLVSMVPGQKLQIEAIRKMATGGMPIYDREQGGNVQQPMSFRAAQEYVRDNYTLDLGSAKFDTEDPTLQPESHLPSGELDFGGPCSKCPKRSGTYPEAMADIKNPNVCTLPACFKFKNDAHISRQLENYRSEGCTVLTVKESKGLFQHGYLKHDAPYVTVDSVCRQDKKQRSFGAILDNDLKAVVALKDGTPTKLYVRTEVEAALVKKKIIKPKAVKVVDESPAAKAARELQEKVGEEFPKHLYRLVIGAAKKCNVRQETQILQFVAARSLDGNDCDNKLILDQFGIELAGWPNALPIKCAEMDSATAAAFLLAVNLSSYYDGVDIEATQEAAVTIFKIDTKTLENDFRVELRNQLKNPADMSESEFDAHLDKVSPKASFALEVESPASLVSTKPGKKKVKKSKGGKLAKKAKGKKKGGAK